MPNRNSRPVIKVGDRDLRDITCQAVRAIEGANRPTPVVFRFGSSLVRLRILDGAASLEPMTKDTLLNHLAEVAAWQKVKDSQPVPTFPPDRVAMNVLAEYDWPVPVIQRVIHAPVFSADGTLVDRYGYHESAQVFVALDPSLAISPVPPDPTPQEVEAAMTLLSGTLLVDFPFVTEADRAHALGAMLVPFVRPMITGPTPLTLVNAPTKGTGKTLLTEAIVHPATGKPGVSTEAKTEEEWRKRVGALLSSGPSVIWIDNVKGHLDSGALAAVLTEELWVDRLLGRNDKTIRYPNTALWIATGNGVTLSDELARRTIPINIDAGVENPYQRDTASFRIPNLKSWMRERRSILIWACTTIIRRWIRDGRPAGTETIGSYESWAETIGGILGNIGVEGFLGNLDEFYASSDPETLAWNAFITGWAEAHGRAVVRSSELLPVYDSLEDDFLALGTKDDRIRASSLGNRLLNQRDRIFAGYKLVKVDTNQGGTGGGSNRCRETRERCEPSIDRWRWVMSSSTAVRGQDR